MPFYILAGKIPKTPRLQRHTNAKDFQGNSYCVFLNDFLIFPTKKNKDDNFSLWGRYYPLPSNLENQSPRFCFYLYYRLNLENELG